MKRLSITTPSRLHFGLLAQGPNAPRQFGGVGLIIDKPGLAIDAKPASEWSAAGPLGERVLQVAKRVAQEWLRRGVAVNPLSFQIKRGAPEHVGLGTGTQLSLATARLISVAADRPEISAATLAELAGRGARSGIGLHGFARGGLIVDGGRRTEAGIPPLVARLEFPADWHALVVIPPGISGLHGSQERDAFSQLPPISDAVSDRLCRLVLLGLLPAVAERDLDAFGAVLTAIQLHVGRAFAPAQGNRPYSSPDAERVIAFLRSEGLVGVGQSSWGPALYAFARFDAERRAAVLRDLDDHFRIDGEHAYWTVASTHGAAIIVE